LQNDRNVRDRSIANFKISFVHFFESDNRLTRLSR
jgi:hypothetical protein